MASVWCADDRNDALKRALLGEPVSPKQCDQERVLDQFALGKRLGFFGTPTVVAETGKVIGGYLTPDQMLQVLRDIDQSQLSQ